MLKPALRNRCRVDSCRLPFGRPMFRMLPLLLFHGAPLRVETMKPGIIHIGGTPDKRRGRMPTRSRREGFPVEWSHAARSTRKEGGHAHSRMKCAPWGTLNTEKWTGTPLPDEMRSLGYPRDGKVDGQGSGRTDGEGAGRRPGQDPPLPSARSARGGAPVRLHARRHRRRDVRIDPCPAIPFPRSAGVRGLPSGSPFLGVRDVPAARPGPRGQDAARGGDRVPARGASRGDRGGGLPVTLRGDGPPGVPGAFHRSVGRLRPFGGRRILPGRPLLAGRTAVSGIPMEHRGGAPERGGALQDPLDAVFVPASRGGTWTPGRTFSR